MLPMSRAEMDVLGWDSCDIIIVTGDAYVDHPSFGMAVIGRMLEAQGFRVGIIAQPDWHDATEFRALGKPNLFFGITAGNMDSMVNRYTADRRIRSDDAYTPGDVGGKRPDRAVLVVEHTDQAVAERMGFLGRAILVGARRGSGGGNLEPRIVDRIARPVRRLGHMQCQRRQVAAGFPGLCSL